MSARTKRISLHVLLALSFAANSFAGTPDKLESLITVQWNDVGDLLLGHRIMVALPNGAVVEGKVLSLNSDSLDLQVSKTSDSQIQSKGKLNVPRSSLHLLKMKRPQKKWRIILTSVGAGAAIPFWGLFTYSYNEAGGAPPPPLPAMMAAGGTVGYLAGWGLDRHHDITITIP